jgi:FkbM family methyltransferase
MPLVPWARDALVHLCRTIDRALRAAGLEAREEVSGPILEAVMRGRVFSKELRDGTVIEMRYGNKISRDFLLSPDPRPDHVWEPQTTKLLLRFASTARQAVVGGAWIGDQAVLIARRMQATGGTCHAFEPDPEAFAFLKRNAESNRLGNLVCNPVGLWSRETAILLLGRDAYGSPQEAGEVAPGLPAVSLNHYARTQGFAKVDLLMLDTEGGEEAALRGASDFLCQRAGEAPSIVFEIHRHYVDWSRGLDETGVVRSLRGYGYEIFAVRDYHSNHPMEAEPVELIPTRDVHLEGPPHGFNMLAVKEPATIRDPFFRIVRGVSPKLLRNRDPALHQPLR